MTALRTNPPALLFVYGTLMRGEQHHDLMATATFLRDAHTEPAFDLVRVDYYPALVSGGTTCVSGELFAVDAATLALLDELEDVPALYLREIITLAHGVSAFAYLLPRERAASAPRIASGSFRAAVRSGP